jgi:hypothetical protein
MRNFKHNVPHLRLRYALPNVMCLFTVYSAYSPMIFRTHQRLAHRECHITLHTEQRHLGLVVGALLLWFAAALDRRYSLYIGYSFKNEAPKHPCLHGPVLLLLCVEHVPTVTCFKRTPYVRAPDVNHLYLGVRKKGNYTQNTAVMLKFTYVVLSATVRIGHRYVLIKRLFGT